MTSAKKAGRDYLWAIAGLSVAFTCAACGSGSNGDTGAGGSSSPTVSPSPTPSATTTTPALSAVDQQFVDDMQSAGFASVPVAQLVALGEGVCSKRESGVSQAAILRAVSDQPDGAKIARLAETDICSGYLPTVKPKVIFRFWGSGSPDITYGDDSSNLSGSALPFHATLPYHRGALYYAASAQLNGSGVVHCEVIVRTADGTYRKKGIASGGFNICSAQLNNETALGEGWS
jgi:hypothetical protein